MLLMALALAGLPSAGEAARRQAAELQEQKLQLEIAALETQAKELARRQQLEVRKLEEEINALREQPSPWLAPLLTVLSVFGGFVAGFVGAKIAAKNALGLAVHEQRLDMYPRLVRATAPLAIYFPDYTGALEPRHCARMGQAMSKWYFNGGGILLSDDARKAYFALARVLTRASQAKDLRTPTFPADAPDVSAPALEALRRKLEIGAIRPLVEAWKFGEPAGSAAPEERFRDYVFLQHVSSQLRSELASDIDSRRRTGVALQ